MRLRTFMEVARSLTRPRNRLTALANRYGSDKGTLNFARHNYTRVYEPLFRDLRDSPIRILEIGMLNNGEKLSWRRRRERYSGTATGRRAPSLQMWAAYFPKAEIIGFDINDFSAVSIPRCTIVRGDMNSRDDLQRLVRETGGKFDIIIDDASHASPHQQTALGFLFQHLSPGGLYIIEDLQWQPPWLEEPGVPKTREMLRIASVTGVFETPRISGQERVSLERDVESIRLYDSASTIDDDALEAADAVCVIRKRSDVGYKLSSQPRMATAQPA